MLETFGLSNIAPQVGKGFNRSARPCMAYTWPMSHRKHRQSTAPASVQSLVHSSGRQATRQSAQLHYLHQQLGVAPLCSPLCGSLVTPKFTSLGRDYWARFERFIHLLTRTCDDVYIVTGPLYLPIKTPLGIMMSHPMIGANPKTVLIMC